MEYCTHQIEDINCGQRRAQNQDDFRVTGQDGGEERQDNIGGNNADDFPQEGQQENFRQVQMSGSSRRLHLSDHTYTLSAFPLGQRNLDNDSDDEKSSDEIRSVGSKLQEKQTGFWLVFSG